MKCFVFFWSPNIVPKPFESVCILHVFLRDKKNFYLDEMSVCLVRSQSPNNIFIFFGIDETLMQFARQNHHGILTKSHE